MPLVTIKNGRIHAYKLEFNLASHCNYSCAECSHLSPYLDRELAQTDEFERDVRALAAVYRVNRMHFVGGEPLLNPNIVRFVDIAKKYQLARQFMVTTNGALLHKVPDEVFEAIDVLAVSWYPDPRCDGNKIRLARQKCTQWHTKFQVNRIDTFRLMQPGGIIEDPGRVRDIYQACQIAHSWGCQTLSKGRFYLCSRPVFTDRFLDTCGVGGRNLAELDGCSLHEPDLMRRLVDYLGRKEPLRSCSVCLGTSGRSVDWRQMGNSERRSAKLDGRPLEAALDPDRLAAQKLLQRWQRRIYSVLPFELTVRLLSKTSRTLFSN